MSINKKVHEKYHSSTKKQVKIVNDKNFTYRILLKIINENIKDRKLKILDIGCGAGTLSLYLASKGHEVVGIDISKKAINNCIQSAKILELSSIEFREFDFPNCHPDSKFDFIIFTEVIEHINDSDKAISAIHKLLNKGGTMILSTPSSSAPLHRMGLTKDFDKKVGHVKRYSRKQITDLINRCDFEIQSIYETEGVLRNFLFVNHYAGQSIRFIRSYISDIVTFIDNLTIPFFGSSDIIIIAKKV